jgi:hypothetical protein
MNVEEKETGGEKLKRIRKEGAEERTKSMPDERGR